MVKFLFLIFLLSPSASQNGKESFEIESAVIRCSNPAEIDDDLRVVNWKPPPLTSFNTPIQPGPHDPNSALSQDVSNDIDLNLTRMTNCKTQAVITVKVVHQGMVDPDESGAVIKIDHMLDELTGKPVSLGSPLAIKIQEGPFFAVYPIHFLETVNGKAEEVITNHSDFKSLELCTGDTCGTREDDGTGGDIVHTGFCCSCDDSVNGQLRGGHRCSSQSKPEKFFSKHCFRSSDHWYAVFKIGPPQIFQQVYVQVYKTVEHENGKSEWIPAGKTGQVLKVDSQAVTTFEDGDDLTVTYRKVMYNPLEQIDQLESSHNVLLVPTIYYASTKNPHLGDSLVSEGIDRHFEIYRYIGSESGKKENSTDLLPGAWRGSIDQSVMVVPKTLVGPKCSQVGVSSRVFYAQPTPCHESAGTCLRNQPFDLWESENENPSGVKYRLKNFGQVHHPSPFKRILGQIHVVMEHRGETAAYIDVQYDADDLEVIRPGYNAQLVSVLTGSTNSGAKIIAELANPELAPAQFSLHVLSCTQPLPLQKTEFKTLGPRRMAEFHLDMPFQPRFQLRHRAHCAVGVLNQYHQVVAFRTVALSPGDTCTCSLNCRCTCSQDSKVSCDPMSPDELLATGLSPEEFEVEGDQVEDLLSEKNLLWVLFLLILLLVSMGLLKAIVGRTCSRRLGTFGLGYFLNRPRHLDRYYEKEYGKVEVIYDDNGRPVDPFTKRPTIDRLSWRQELWLNLIFFLCWPIFCIGNCFGWCFRSRKPNQETDKDSSLKTSSPSKPQTGSRTRFDDKSGSKPNGSASGTRLASMSPSSEAYFLKSEVDGIIETAINRILVSGSGRLYGSWHKNGGKQGGSQDQKGQPDPEVREGQPGKSALKNPLSFADYSKKSEPIFTASESTTGDESSSISTAVIKKIPRPPDGTPSTVLEL